MAIAQALQTGVQANIGTYATTVSSALSASLAPVAITGVTIYLFILGWAIARGEVQSPMSTLVWKVFKIALIVGIALVGGVYQSVVIDFIDGIEGVFTNAIGGSPTIGLLIDTSIVPMETLTGLLWTRANAPMVFPDFGLVCIAVLCTLGQVLITVASLIPLLVAKVTVALLLAIGPVFVLLALWPATQRFTESWLAATLSAVFTVVVIAAVVGFLPAYINYYANQVLVNLATVNLMQSLISLVIVIFVLAWIAWKASEFGAQIVGGGSMGNPAQSVAQTIMNRFAFGRNGGAQRQPPPPIQNTIAPSGGTPLAQQNVITNLNRQR